MALQEKTERTIGRHLKDIVFAANDGIITTFAVIAGVTGAALSSTTVIIIGFASLVADAFSMASGNYLGTKSEQDFYKKEHHNISRLQSPAANSLITFVSFILAGTIPLLPYVSGSREFSFFYSALLAGLTLFAVGALRTFFSARHWLRLGSEMLFIAGLAAFLAYIVGFFLKSLATNL